MCCVLSHFNTKTDLSHKYVTEMLYDSILLEPCLNGPVENADESDHVDDQRITIVIHSATRWRQQWRLPVPGEIVIYFNL